MSKSIVTPNTPLKRRKRGRPPTPQKVVELIESIWAEDTKQSAEKVHESFKDRTRTRKVSLRTVQNILSAAKGRAGETFIPAPWHPWLNKPGGTAEDIKYLLQVDALALIINGRHLYQHEARWARKLRVALEGLPIPVQYSFISQYALREQIQFNLQQSSPYTADLDALLGLSPWLATNKPLYEFGIVAGTIPPPVSFFLEEQIRDVTKILEIAMHPANGPWLDPRDPQKFPFVAYMVDRILGACAGTPADYVDVEDQEGEGK